LKKGDEGGFERNKFSLGPSFPKRGNYLSYYPPVEKGGKRGICFLIFPLCKRGTKGDLKE